MTPKEKAELLYKTIDNVLAGNKSISYHRDTKQCALIVVVEMLNELPDGYMGNFDEERKQFWKDVKTEIENL